MEILSKVTDKNSCGCSTDGAATTGVKIVPLSTDIPDSEKDIPCCGSPAGPAASRFEKPGFTLCHYVDGFAEANNTAIPRVTTKLNVKDYLSSALVRMGFGRNEYKVTPGLYCVGTPDSNSPVIVTANYKLSFDYVRKELSDIDAFILVLDTRGINVWCAAGKGSFGTDELIRQIRLSSLETIVEHRKLIVPQLGAVGVAGLQVKKQTGFEVLWGPIQARDLKSFIRNNYKADEKMRQVTFTLWERLLVVPVEITLSLKPAAILIAAMLVLSGIGPDIFSFSKMVGSIIPVLATLFAGILSGTIITPVLLNKLPGVAFSVKGFTSGSALLFSLSLYFGYPYGFSGILALFLVPVSISSYLAMNFTGTTPFTSPSGVEFEMRKAIPIQLGCFIIGMIFWIVSAF